MATTKKAIAEAEQAAEIKETIAAPTTEPGTPAVTLDELESMDMNMVNAEETESAPRPAWRIADDGCAVWACRKIAEEKTELDRITALGESQIEKIQQRIDAAQRRYENGTRFLTGKLAEYFETVPHKTTKTKHSYRLLSGTLVKKIGGSTMKQDDDTLLAYLKASGIKIFDVEIEKSAAEHLEQVNALFSIRLPKQFQHTEVLAKIATMDGILAIEEV